MSDGQLLNQEQIDSLINSMQTGKSNGGNVNDFYICKYCWHIHNISFSFSTSRDKRLLSDSKRLSPTRLFLDGNKQRCTNPSGCQLVLFSDLLKNTISYLEATGQQSNVPMLVDILAHLMPVRVTYDEYKAKAMRYKALLEDMRLNQAYLRQ